LQRVQGFTPARVTSSGHLGHVQEQARPRTSWGETVVMTAGIEKSSFWDQG
jgi:hypothetical protein